MGQTAVVAHAAHVIAATAARHLHRLVHGPHDLGNADLAGRPAKRVTAAWTADPVAVVCASAPLTVLLAVFAVSWCAATRAMCALGFRRPVLGAAIAASVIWVVGTVLLGSYENSV